MTRCDYRDRRRTPIDRKERGFPRTFAALTRAALLSFFAIRHGARGAAPADRPVRPGLFSMSGDSMTANVSGIGSVLQQMQSMAAQASG
ncbi:hypothetical protein, partial [Klebsiella pneumoniae]|uniref:hypothetical protein n=1 Tax=Klebsiella pneumoniae TaxID=573 RepID=UPI001C5FEB7A